MSMFSGLSDPNNRFNSFMTLVFDLLYVNFLFLLSCIPVVTIGAACTSMYYVIAKVLRHGRSSVTKEYLHAMRQNLKPATILNLIWLLILAIGALNIFYYYELSASVRLAYLIVGASVLFVLITTYFYVYPFLSRIEIPTLSYLKFAFLVSLQHLGSTLVFLLIFLLCLASVVFCLPLLLIMPALFYWSISHRMELLMKQHVNYSQCSEDSLQDPWYLE